MEAKELQQVKKKIPQFQTVRKNLYNNHTPPVNLEIAYQRKDTNEVIIFHGTSTPISRFPPHEFEKLYEMATVKVIISFFLNCSSNPTGPMKRTENG